MNVIFEILIMLLILGVLISIHEAGHLGMAKLFKVYCFEYSIGMGPAILHKKKKDGETYFSIRAVPFGGYVSMYGEAENIQLEPGEVMPDESRSLEFIAKWKKVLILFAGVFLNFVLGLILIFISVSCFSQYAAGYAVPAEGHQAAFVLTDYTNDTYTYDELNKIKPSNVNVEDYDLFLGLDIYKVGEITYESPTVVSTDVVISTHTGSTENYVAVYTPSNLTSNHSLLNDLYFFKPLKNDQGEIITLGEPYSNLGYTYIPDINDAQNNYFDFSNGNTYTLSMTLHYSPIRVEEFQETTLASSLLSVKYENIKINDKSREGMNVTIKPFTYRNSFSEAVDKWEYYVPYCCTAIAKGFASLFTKDGISNLSGVVGMTAMVGTYSAMGGASMLFLFAGLISINLAFFNLIPFPGLDGYQILVTAIEGVTKKKVPNKVKAIVSYIGLGLLFALMIVITIKDIIRLV